MTNQLVNLFTVQLGSTKRSSGFSDCSQDWKLDET